MSGSRGGRGGRGGGQKHPRDLPWQTDPSLKPDLRPTELFPEYKVPDAPPLSKREEKQLAYFLHVRQQMHDGPLYTQTRTAITDPGDSGRTYGQEQARRRYGVKSKATVDPFWAVPMYTHRFSEKKRALPDLSGQRFVKDFFPAELHAILGGESGGVRPAKRRKLPRTETTQSRRAAEADDDVLGVEQPELSDEEQKKRAREALDSVREDQHHEGGGGGGGGEDTKDGEEGKDGEASDDGVAMEQGDDEWAVGRYDEDLDLYEEPDLDAEELGEEEGEGDYDIQQHYEEGDDDDDGDGGDYEDGGEG